MSGILIVDAGSTKTTWSLLNNNKKEPIRLRSIGINSAHYSFETIIGILQDVRRNLPDFPIDDIYYFGAGCSTVKIKDKVKQALWEVFKINNIWVDSDLRAAAIATFGYDNGIIGIMGTGSNSGLFLNGKIKTIIPSLGYVLGDEGSGVALGKILLNSVFKQQLPKFIIEIFFQEFQITTEEIIHKVYRSESPASYIASFSPFLLKHINNPEISTLVINEFDNFFLKNIIPMGDISLYKLGLVGSIAWNFKEQVKASAQKYGININSIIKEPMPLLEKYYSGK